MPYAILKGNKQSKELSVAFYRNPSQANRIYKMLAKPDKAVHINPDCSNDSDNNKYKMRQQQITKLDGQVEVLTEIHLPDSVMQNRLIPYCIRTDHGHIDVYLPHADGSEMPKLFRKFALSLANLHPYHHTFNLKNTDHQKPATILFTDHEAGDIAASISLIYCRVE